MGQQVSTRKLQIKVAAAIQQGQERIAGRSKLIDRALQHLRLSQGKHWEGATPHDKYVSLALAVRDLAVERMIQTQAAYAKQDVKRVYYLSLEFLLGRLLRNNLVNLGLYGECCSVVSEDSDFDHIFDVEPDAGLGNGGLGRLAACYMDSAASQGYPVYGYSIRYEHGMFHQEIENGWQVERPEYWLRFGTPWELMRPEFATIVRLRGHVEHRTDSQGRYRPAWVGYHTVVGIPYDIPMVGYGGRAVNILRLWASSASEMLNLEAFNQGGYLEAVREKVMNETISKVLYPADQTQRGRHLRLVQQYFFVACTLADILRRYDRDHDTIDDLPNKVAIHLNDTHPSIAIAEMMRILVDDRGLDWDRAWEMTQAIFAYTNHTLLPEALETWPVWMFEQWLPRHLQIIYEINKRFLEQVDRRWPGDDGRKRRMSLIQEDNPRSIRMAHLAIVGSHTVNGVAELHSRLIRQTLVPDFAELWPDRFTNVTNGITPRRWLKAANPGLAAAITRRLGEDWVCDLNQLKGLTRYADDPEFQDEFRQVKQANKRRLCEHVLRTAGVNLLVDSLFDVQSKRLHEYKRQLLNILHVVMLYHEMLSRPQARVPRAFIFAAKAAPSYHRAKLIIKLIHDVARTINADKRLDGRLRVVFVPDYCVSVAEIMVPAADLSEQISTAGMEASGTGNMKFALNGALTIGTLDGANIEIREAVGAENFFLFGLTAEEVAELRPRYNPWEVYHSNPAVRQALDGVADGEFNPEQPHLFKQVRDWLTSEGDRYMLLADIESYAEAQRRVDALWRDPAAWTRKAILNVANMGKFSSDRSVNEYAQRIWNTSPVRIDRIPIDAQTSGVAAESGCSPFSHA
ncbi:MAG TPA: glycogen/starch/alpha-glucan phosphorylase [Phycisphaerae bacterium]|nr:glycogen/starch/alpha-glucan phosphorylase [Phycisphaerae bacterium]HRR83383.1 glycogen/starch/alpha-glucan phosphorylase [Phycisphaerae bacterium]